MNKVIPISRSSTFLPFFVTRSLTLCPTLLFSTRGFVVSFKGAFTWPSSLHFLPSFLSSLISFLSTSFLPSHSVSCKRCRCQPQVSLSRSPNSRFPLCENSMSSRSVLFQELSVSIQHEPFSDSATIPFNMEYGSSTSYI